MILSLKNPSDMLFKHLMNRYIVKPIKPIYLSKSRV